MKYSFIMPYYDRIPQLHGTFESFHKFYSDRNDFEIIIVEDTKQTSKMHVDLLNLLNANYDRLNIVHIKSAVECAFNPSTAFNEGVSIAQGEYIILTSPECMHEVDILKEFDHELEMEPENYIVCACKSIKQNGAMHMWYQHSKFRNVKYHFCSLISKDNYNKIGGFDERYTFGYAYDDDSFRDRVIKLGIPMSVRDDLLVSHQWHDKVKPPDYRLLLKKNRDLYQEELNNA